MVLFQLHKRSTNFSCSLFQKFSNKTTVYDDTEVILWIKSNFAKHLHKLIVSRVNASLSRHPIVLVVSISSPLPLQDTEHNVCTQSPGKLSPLHANNHLLTHMWFDQTNNSYRVSRNIVSTFVLLISQPPKHLQVPSWKFLNSPFCVDFKTIQFVIIWWNLDQDMAKILKGSHFKN